MKKSLFKSKMTAVAIAGVAIVLVALGLMLPGSNNLDNGDMKNASAKKKIEKFEDKSRAKDRKYDVRYRLEPVFSFYGVFVCCISGCCNMDHQNVSRTVMDRGH